MTSSSPLRPRSSILVVDDDQFFRDMIRAELEAAGFQVTHAIDVQAAHQVIANNAADVMLLDFVLPDGTAMDIWEFTKQQNPRLASRTVVITGVLNDAERREIELRMGAPVLTKPFEPEVLIHLLQRVALGLE